MIQRRRTREVAVGNVVVGGSNPIAVQSMCTTPTKDVEATVSEIIGAADAGCEIGRVSVFDEQDADALAAVRRRSPIPLVADIHFRASFALKALEAGIDKIRLNPGNIGGFARAKPIIEKARDRGVPMRIGVNSGSVERDLLEKYGYPSPQAMVESALRHVEFCESLGYHELIVSIKSSDVVTTVQNYRLFSKQSDYPLHIGVTEAGLPGYGTIKSAIGIGALLVDGIGDTIRVSTIGHPRIETEAAWDILKATGARVREPEIIACPTCGRIAIDLEKAVREVKERIKDVRTPMKISILGCAVNGPGEAREADIGVAGGNGEALIFKKGKVLRKVKEDQLVDELVKEIRLHEAELKAASASASVPRTA